MTKKLFLALLLALAMAVPAQAIVIDPTLGLTDFIFSFDGDLGAALGDNVTWSGDPTADLTLTTATSFDIHVEDCCVVGDEWDLVIDSVVIPWDVFSMGDGVGNSGAFIGAGGPYFEALATVVLPSGFHTIDLHQTAGIPGGSWFNMSAGTAVPEPMSLALMGLGLAALGWGRRRTR